MYINPAANIQGKLKILRKHFINLIEIRISDDYDKACNLLKTNKTSGSDDISESAELFKRNVCPVNGIKASYTQSTRQLP